MHQKQLAEQIKTRTVQTERGPSQPIAAQMLHASGERKGRSVDRRRGGVLQASPSASCARAAAPRPRGVRTRHADRL